MARYRFREGVKYGARLLRVVERPIENSPSSGLRLPRLESEVFAADELRRVLSSTGTVACRDLVVGSAAAAFKDSSLIAYAYALRLRNPSDPPEWLRLNGQQPWLAIVFGAVGDSDLRNAFQSVFPLDPGDWSVREYQCDLDKNWVTVAQAARDLKTSESSFRRRVRELEPAGPRSCCGASRAGIDGSSCPCSGTSGRNRPPRGTHLGNVKLVSNLSKKAHFALGSV